MGNGAQASASPVGPLTSPPMGASGPPDVSRRSSQVTRASLRKPVPVSVPVRAQSDDAAVATDSSMAAVTVTR